MKQIQGMGLVAEASKSFDYESAISAAAEAAKTADGVVLFTLQNYLKSLCDDHLQALKE